MSKINVGKTVSRLALEPRYVFDAALAAEFMHHIDAIEVTLSTIDTSSWSGVSLAEAFESLKASQQAIVDVLTAMPSVEKIAAVSSANVVETGPIQDFARPIYVDSFYPGNHEHVLIEDTDIYIFPPDQVFEVVDPLLIGDAKPIDNEPIMIDDTNIYLNPTDDVVVVFDPNLIGDAKPTDYEVVMVDDTGMYLNPTDQVVDDIDPLLIGDAKPIDNDNEPIMIDDTEMYLRPTDEVVDVFDPHLIGDAKPTDYEVVMVDDTGMTPDPIVDYHPMPTDTSFTTESLISEVDPEPIMIDDTGLAPTEIVEPIKMIDPVEYPLPEVVVDTVSVNTPTINTVDDVFILPVDDSGMVPTVTDPILTIDPVEYPLPEQVEPFFANIFERIRAFSAQNQANLALPNQSAVIDAHVTPFRSIVDLLNQHHENHSSTSLDSFFSRFRKVA